MSKKKKTFLYYLKGAWSKAGRFILPKYKRKHVTLFRYTSALGDALFLTTLAREVRKRNSTAFIHVITGLPQLFDRNPDVNLVTTESNSENTSIGQHLIHYEKNAPWEKHILYYCAKCIDINDEIDLRTYIFPTSEDFLWADSIVNNHTDPIILINRLAGPRTDKKNWPDNYWQILIPQLTKLGVVIEIGTTATNDVPVTTGKYINLVGSTSLHQTAALMSKSSLLICPVTGLLHLASAFDLPTLCILGGSEPAIGTRYKNTEYLENRPWCADCYEKGPCTNNFLCLNEIHPDQVYKKAAEILNK